MVSSAMDGELVGRERDMWRSKYDILHLAFLVIRGQSGVPRFVVDEINQALRDSLAVSDDRT